MRQLTEYITRARQMPPHILIQKVASLSLRKAKRSLSKAYYSNRKSYGNYRFEWREPVFKMPEKKYISHSWPVWKKALDHIMNHEFDLLGSGWVKVGHKSTYSKVAGKSYAPQDRLEREEILEAKEINTANQSYSKRILGLIDKDYEFIDWHIDFKCGYRWDPATWWEDVPYAHKKGVDIKVPWELSRMQHLPWLAYGYYETNNEKYVEEFQNQVLDFIANNPPRFGVNWKCPMDVSIRSANWVMAFDLFRNQGFQFSEKFKKILGHALIDHGLFVEQNFEKATDFRGNHYLADVAGLTFVAFCMEAEKNVDRWKSLCTEEVVTEARYQFHDLGTNFEGSTAYHRLSAEMLYYPLLYISLQNNNWDLFKNNTDLSEKIIGACLFSQVVTKPDHSIVQVGDNDIGRFFKLMPAWYDESLFENHLNLTHIASFVDGLFIKTDVDLESSLVKNSVEKIPGFPSSEVNQIRERHLLKTQRPFETNHLDKKLSKTPQTLEYRFPISPNCLENFSSHFYEDFGLIVFKGESFFLSFRCGPVGQLGRGGHDHNDQLSIELFIKGENILLDPGTFLYTPWPEKRNQYRSNQFHFLPQPENQEMADIQSALFFIGQAKRGHLLKFNERSCLGYCDGFGFPITREIVVGEEEVIIRDSSYSSTPLWNLKNFQPLTYSRGYGYPRF